MEVCSKIATLTDTRNRLELPIETLNHIVFPQGQHYVDLLVTDSSGQPWTFSCCKRREGYPKPCLRTGWLVFVRSKDVRIGDRIILRRLDGGEFKIEVKRRTNFMLFGENVWVDVVVA
ncbi:hypothetical protein Pint_18167 [Pistacia integerrima]|uniref:Uncharacterized protein n=1 Tax=Pistacia integerrima TaxID=434235 RepID=A0ACC0YWF0_9ROSI|nr:hypothetical protein Pint_18167 [Pistacia integerrima]